jgi:hypothetical protein
MIIIYEHTGVTHMTKEQSDPVLACNIQAIPQGLRPLHQANTKRIFTAVLEVQELSTGYALRLPNETDLLQSIMNFISYERLCCPFFRFKLEVEPEQGPIWFSLTGASDIKAFLQGEGFTPPDESAHS